MMAAAVLALVGSAACSEPAFVAEPSSRDYFDVYPRTALRMGIGGEATLHCLQDAFGGYSDCKVLNETPAGLGFGAAALALAPRYRTASGLPGRAVDIPVRFRGEAAQAAPTPPKPTSEGALAVARRLVAAAAAADVSTSPIERAAREIEVLDDSGLSPDTRTGLSAALRASLPAGQRRTREALARAYAGMFSEAQLKAVLDFYATEAGQVLLTRDEDVEALDTTIASEATRLTVPAAQKAYCAAHVCKDPRFQAAQKAEISDPQWVKSPTPGVLFTAVPNLSRLLQFEARVLLLCTVTREGKLTNCSVAAEEPQGLAYGAAALGLADDYQLSPIQLADGDAGRTVSVLVPFPGGGSSTEPPFGELTPRSPAAMALALQLVNAKGEVLVGESMKPEPISRMRNLLIGTRSEASVEMPKAERDGVLDAMLQGLALAEKHTHDLEAAFLTLRMTDAQMGQALAFWRTPTGTLWKARTEQYGSFFSLTKRLDEGLIWADAGVLFCKAHGCTAAGAQPSMDASPAASTAKP